MQIINDTFLDEISSQAKSSPRQRMNYNFHQSLDDKCQRLLNAMEPGTEMPIHKHDHEETYFVLRGKLETQQYDGNGKVIKRDIIDPKQGNYGVRIPAETWHCLTVLEENTVIFEAAEGPYKPRTADSILNLDNKNA